MQCKQTVIVVQAALADEPVDGIDHMVTLAATRAAAQAEEH